MLVDNNDQAQQTETTESTEAAETAENQDNQGSQENEQSNQTQEQPTFEIAGGRKVDAQTLHGEYGKLQVEFTHRSQRLKEIERENAEFRKLQEQSKSQVTENVDKAIEENPTLKNVDPAVKELLKQLVGPMMTEHLNKYELQKSEAQKQAEADRAFENELQGLEKEYNGKNPKYPGLKFDRAAVLKAMQDPNNKIFDPRAKFKEMNEAAFIDASIKEALKKQQGGNNSERTGGEGPRMPDGDAAPKTWKEASQRAARRFA